MSKLKKLFRNVYDTARDVQTKDQNKEDVDGRAIWNEIEESVKSIDIEGLEYREELKPIYEKMEVIIDKYKMRDSEMDPKSNHFFMQLKNLVDKKSNFQIKMNRVLQIAYNIGQLSIFIERGKLPQDIVDFVEEHNLLDLDTYISLENQQIINERYLRDFNIDMKGGSYYYSKYLKYKTKYLQLSNIQNGGR
jgi:hypothetical protein